MVLGNESTNSYHLGYLNGVNLFFMVSDPDGNSVELSAEIEIVGADRKMGTWLHEERTLNYWGKGMLRVD